MRDSTWCGLVGGMLLISAARADDGDVFDRLDANEDGFVTADEVDADKKRLFDRLLRTSDANEDGKLTRDEFTAGTTAKPRPDNSPPPRPQTDRRRPTVQQVFQQFDKDGDGVLTKDEVPEQLAENFERVDSSGNGTIERAELAKVLREISQDSAKPQPGGQQITPQVLRQAFLRYDTDKDGLLTRDEVPANRRQALSQMIRQFDDNDDDKLSLEEYVRGSMAMVNRQAGMNPSAPTVVFRTLDKDGDGQLSADEIASAADSLGKLDRNSDGSLSRQELAPAAANRPDSPIDAAVIQGYLRRVMQADKDGDGKLNRDEATGRLAEFFDRIDTSGDGELDKPEIVEAMRRGRELLKQPK